MAKPTPELLRTGELMAKFTPTTWPLRFEQRAARIAGVDGGVGLNDIRQRIADIRKYVADGHAAADSADNPTCHGSGQAKGIADGDDHVTHTYTVGIGQRQWPPVKAFGRRHFQDSQIGLRIGGHDSGVSPEAVVEDNGDLERRPRPHGCWLRCAHRCQK